MNVRGKLRERNGASPGRRDAGRRGWRLGRRSRKGVLVVHIVSAGAWIGIDVVLAILVFTALVTDDVDTATSSYRVLTFTVWPLFLAGLVCLASGVTSGLGTKYGLVRYWWVAVKLVINVVFVALVPLALRPPVLEAAEYGRDLTAGQPTFPVTELLFPPIVSLSGLLVAVVLAVYKPWGRLRAGGRS